MDSFIVPKTTHPNSDFAAVEDIHPQEVYDLKDAVQLIDVRRPEEFIGEYGHVPGSELVVLDTLPLSVDKLDKQQSVVLICRSGGRSARAAQFLKEQGFKSVYNMEGGMMAWDALGLPSEGKSKI